MNKEDVIRLAREADLEIENGMFDSKIVCVDGVDITKHLEVFANLVAEHEREACAKVCDALSDRYSIGFYGSEVDALDEAAMKIRAADFHPKYEPCPFIECDCDGNHPLGSPAIRARS